MKCIDPLVTGYERGTFEERSARTESSPRQSGKNSEDDSRANNNIRETLGILSLPTMAPNGIKMYLGLKWPLASLLHGPQSILNRNHLIGDLDLRLPFSTRNTINLFGW